MLVEGLGHISKPAALAPGILKDAFKQRASLMEVSVISVRPRPQ